MESHTGDNFSNAQNGIQVNRSFVVCKRVEVNAISNGITINGKFWMANVSIIDIQVTGFVCYCRV